MGNSAYYYPSPKQIGRSIKYDRSQGTFFNRKTKRPLNLIYHRNEQVLSTKNGLIPAGDLAYALVHGEWPTGQINYGNGDVFDLRWANLTLDAPRHKGVYWYKRSRRWQGMFQHNRTYHHVGYFDDQEAAAEAVAEAKEALASSGG